MPFNRRDILKLTGATALSGSLPGRARSAEGGVYDLKRFGNAESCISPIPTRTLPGYFP